MPRQADRLFLKLAVQRGALTQQDSDDVWEELLRLEEEGSPTKARHLCLELGFIDEALGKQLKDETRAHLERKEREVHADSRLDRRIAGFELLERLGSGAMGVVFKARHLGLAKLVALKVLNPELALDGRYVDRFLQEARVAAELDHPNIVRAFDVGQKGDVHYIAMEFVEGKTVKELIERRGKLDEQAATEIVLQVVDALRHAHERSLIHRDIKPANIMITRDGQAKVLDLGLAKRTDVDNGLTAEGRAIGTPYFMAPEQALDKGADYRADIYALGATFFNMVTGEKPYQAGTPVAVMNMHLKAPIPDARALNPAVSEGLSRVIKKMLAKRPADRYQDHDALAGDLEAVLGGLMPALSSGAPPAGLDVIASRPQARARSTREVQARGGGFPVVAAAAALCLLVGGALAVRAWRADPQKPPPPVAPLPQVDDEKVERERAATALLADVDRGGGARGRAQARSLLDVAERFPETEAGRRARGEAEALLRSLDEDERTAVDARRKALRQQAAQGQRLEAARGLEALAKTVEAGGLRNEVEAEAVALRRALQEEADRIAVAAEGQFTQGDPAGAAATLRGALALVEPGPGRDQVSQQIDAYARAAASKAAEEREARARADAEADAAEAGRVDDLVRALREQVRGGDLPGALERARGALAGLRTPPQRARAEAHVEALAAAHGLEALCGEALGKIPLGERVDLERVRGKAVAGTVSAATPGKLTVAVGTRQEEFVRPADLTEREQQRLVRRHLPEQAAALLRGTAALKLYRGDRDAGEALARARDAGVDLARVADDLARASAPVDLAAATQPQTPDGPPPDRPPTGPDRPPADPKQERRALAMRLAEKGSLLFREADQIGANDTRTVLFFDFQNRDGFGGNDWRQAGGRVYRTPPGQSERTGLVLEGAGRAEFAAPVEGNFEVELAFMTQLVSDRSRLAITLKAVDESRVITNDLGQLTHATRRGQRTEGQRPKTRLDQHRIHRLMLTRVGDVLISKLDGGQTAELEVKELAGAFSLSVEWGNAALSLVAVKVEAELEPTWANAKLEPLEKSR